MKIEQIKQVMSDLMTARDIAAHFDISHARARALLQNRHARDGVGERVGGRWLAHRSELGLLAPDEKHRRKALLAGIEREENDDA